MTSSDAGATSSSIISLIVLSPMPTLSLALSLTLSPVSTTSGNLIHRQFAGGQLSPNQRASGYHQDTGIRGEPTAVNIRSRRSARDRLEVSAELAELGFLHLAHAVARQRVDE